jgi:membrane protease YdiL (CAAX protease family)
MTLRWFARRWVYPPLRVGGALFRLMLWYLPSTLALLYSGPGVLAIASIATALCAVLWYTRRGKARATAQRWATLRLRPVGPGAPWIAGLAIAAPVGIIALVVLSMRWGYPADQVPDFFGQYIHRPGGWWSVGCMIVFVAPLLEEITFRGWIQRPLERQFGAITAIAISAALFALAHGAPLRLPFLFLFGVIVGAAAYRTRSIWAGVAIHASNNALAALSGVPPVEHALDGLALPTTPELLGAVLVFTALVAFLLRGLWRATRREGLRTGLADTVPRLVPGSVPP